MLSSGVPLESLTVPEIEAPTINLTSKGVVDPAETVNLSVTDSKIDDVSPSWFGLTTTVYVPGVRP